MGKPVAISESEFETEVLKGSGVTIVDFWAEWCGPCKMLAPVLESLAEKLEGRVKIVKVNTDENQELAARYRISAIPTLIIFQSGQEKDRIVGFLPEKDLEQKIQPYLA